MKMVVPVFLILIFAVTVSIFSVFIGDNPISPPLAVKDVVVRTVPQGWGFFTKDPREQVQVLYRVSEDGHLSLMTRSNNDISNLFGLSRRNRRVHLEFMRVNGFLDTMAWFTYSGDNLVDENFYASCKEPISIDGYRFTYVNNGVYLIAKFLKTPWLFRNSEIGFDRHIQYQVIHLDSEPK